MKKYKQTSIKLALLACHYPETLNCYLKCLNFKFIKKLYDFKVVWYFNVVVNGRRQASRARSGIK